jgi:hypothetical protein
LLEYLREAGAAPPPVARPVTGPVETLLADYARYLALPIHSDLGRGGVLNGERCS